MLDSQQADMKVQVTSYQTGWLKSTADVSITGKVSGASSSRPETNVDVLLKVNMDHGPLLDVDNKMEFGPCKTNCRSCVAT